MTATLFLPFHVAIDGDGVPMAGAKLYFYTTGTTTPQDTFTGSDLLSANANPVVADADGLFPPIYLGPGPDYKAILKTSADVTVATRDPIAAPAADDEGGGVVAMQGRLTLATGTPVMILDQASKTVVYYTPYLGNTVGLWSGSRFVPTTFAELSNDLTASAVGKAGPAATANNSNYDLFVWDDGGTVRLTRGPAWTSDTARGTGAGTTEIERVQGILVNAENITNGPTAGFGTYVGTIRTDGSAQTNFIQGAVAANGAAAVLGIWNAYNRREVKGFIGDNTNSWAYTTAAWRAANASNTMRVSYVLGLQEEFVEAEYLVFNNNAGANAQTVVGIGLDSTSAPSGRRVTKTASTSLDIGPYGNHSDRSLGFHFMQAVEFSQVGGTTTWYGDNGGTTAQSGMSYVAWC